MKLFFFILLFLLYPIKVYNDGIPLTNDTIFEVNRFLFYFKIESKKFSEQLLKECIYYEKIQYPDVVLKQAQLETGFYTSDIFHNGNNLFGMKYPKYRKTNAIGVYKEHSQYKHWTDSVKDYRKFQDWYLSLGYRIDEYLVFLQWIKYAEDPLYIPKLVKLNKDIT